VKPAVKKVLTDPLGTLARTIDKFVIGPRRYRSARGYDAHAYWSRRFAGHGDSLRGPGDEGLSEADNGRDYAIAGDAFSAFCQKHGVDFSPVTTLEVGPGTGFYTGLMVGLGARSLTCLDVTDVLFEELRAKFPHVEFRKGDVSLEPIEGTFDVAVMIDVIEHIVTEEALRSGLGNIAGALADDASFVLGPVAPRSRRHLYYVHFWTEDDVKAALPDWNVVGDVEFRSGKLLLLRRGASA
jgi:SAM-dependent methyltransferase